MHSPQEISSVFRELFNNPNTLSNGKEFLDNYALNKPNFLLDTCKLFILSKETVSFRKNVGVLLHILIQDHWESKEIKFNFQKQKKDIRETLLHGILINAGEIKIIQTIAFILVDLIQKDGFEMWSAPLIEFVNWMNSSEIQVIAASLELFCVIFSKMDNRITPIIPQLMPVLFQIFANPDLTEDLREKILILLYLAISSFAYADGVNDQLVKECFDETYQLWISLFTSSLQTSPKSHIRIKKFIVKILIVIFRDFTRYSSKTIQTALQPIWRFFNNLMPLYILTTVYNIPIECIDDNLKEIKKDPSKFKPMKSHGDTLEFFFLEEEFEYQNDVEALSLQMMELVSTIIITPNLYIIVKYGLFPLINTICHFILLTKHQEKYWKSDVGRYLSEEDDEELKLRTISSLSLKLLSDLIEKYGEEAIQILILIAEKFMLDYDENQSNKVIDSFFESINFSDFKSSLASDFDKDKLMYFFKTSNFETSHLDQTWKKKEVSLLLLGSFSEDIIVFQTKYNSTFNLATLIHNLMNLIDNPKSKDILRARVLWCISKFCEILGVKHKELFVPLFENASRCLAEHYDIPVRLVAAKSIALFASKIEKFKINSEQNDLSELVDDESLTSSLFSLMEYINDDKLHIILDAFANLSRLSIPFLQKIAEKGSMVFLRIFQTFNNEYVIGRSVLNLIKLLSSDPKAFIFVYNAFTPFILDCFRLFQDHLVSLQQKVNELIKPADIGILTNLMDIICVFLQQGEFSEISDSLIVLLNPLINIMLLNEDVALQIHSSVCLKSFIIYHKAQIIKLNAIPDVIKVINKISQITTTESCALYLGNLIMLTFHNLTGGVADMNILKALVYKVYKSRMPSIVQGLALVFARMININAKETLNFLTSFSIENRMGLKVLIDKWLLHQPLFKGKFTKNATFLALSKLLLEKDKRVETLLVIGFNPSHTNINSEVYAPFKIMSTLIRCLDNEMQGSKGTENRNAENNEHNKNNNNFNNFKMPRKKDKEDDDNERLDTIGGDDDYDGKFFENDNEDDLNEEENNKEEKEDKEEYLIEVDLEKIRDDEEMDIEKRFNQLTDKKDRGLADLEVGSECYMSEMLDFEFDDGEECDETTEQDLILMDDLSIKFELKDMLRNFFNDFGKKEGEYFMFCLKHLIKEDISLLQKYIKIKGF